MKHLLVFILAAALLPAATGLQKRINQPAPSSPSKAFLRRTSPPTIKAIFNCTSPSTGNSSQINHQAITSPIIPYLMNPTGGSKPGHFPPNCTISHYTMYSRAEQEEVVKACFEHTYWEKPLPPYAVCDPLTAANTTQEHLLPEFAEMKANFTRLATQFDYDRKVDDLTVKMCFRGLTEHTNWIQHEMCDSLRPKTRPMNPTLREAYRLRQMDTQLRAFCFAEQETGNHTLKLCYPFHKQFVESCFFGLTNDSFCETVRTGPPAPLNEDEDEETEHLDQLHFLYINLGHYYASLVKKANNCFRNHRWHKARSCRGINWDRRSKPPTFADTMIRQYYRELVELDNYRNLILANSNGGFA